MGFAGRENFTFYGIMNHYFFALMPEARFSRKIEELRSKLIGSKLVDALPPHLTLKRRFSLKQSFSEQNLKEVLNSFSLSKIIANNNKIERLGEVAAIKIKNIKLKEQHKKLYGLLRDMAININPEHEDDNFTAHLTLFRDPENKLSPNWNSLDIKKIVFNKICLYEIDPTPERHFAYIIKCRYLK